MGNQLIKSAPSASSSSSSSASTGSVPRSLLSNTVVVGLVDQSPPLVAAPTTMKPRSYLFTVTTTQALLDAALMGTGNAKGSKLIPAAAPSSPSTSSSSSSSSSSSPSPSPFSSSSSSPDTPEQVALIKVARLSTFFLDLSHLNLRELCGKSVSQAHNLRGLQLGFNKLASLPVEIGSLSSLCFLDLSSNLLTTLPESLSSLHFLIELKLARNRLTALPDSLFSSLTKLESLDLSHNQFDSVSAKVADLTSLIALHLDGNPLAAVPFELGKLKFLRTVTLEGCPLLEDLPENLRAIVESAAANNAPTASASSGSAATTSSSVTAEAAAPAPQPPKGPSTFPSLKELAARVLVRHSVPVAHETVPQEVADYLNTAQTCSFCQGPYFEHHVKRYRFAVRGGTTFPMESRLCSAHWHTEKERILALFRPAPSTSPKKLDEQKLQLIASRQARPVATRRSSSVSIASMELAPRPAKKINWVARATSRKLKGKGLAANTSNLGASADSHAPSTPTSTSPSSASLTASTSNGGGFIRRRKMSSSDVMSSPEVNHPSHKMETENEQIKSMKASTSSLF